MKQLLFAFFFVFISALSTQAQVTTPAEKVVIDNDKIRVTEYVSKPGQDVCGTGKHTHKDHVTILVTDAKVKTVKADGTTEMETFSASKNSYTVIKNGKTETIPVDGAFWAAGTTHTVTNVGNKPMKFYIVETKQ